MSYQIHIGPNIRKSPFFESTVKAGVKGFSVYNHMYMPGNFGAPEAELDRLMNGVAMWDVGGERQVEVSGPDAFELVQYLCTRDLSKTKPGQGYYVPLCNRNGLLINDPVLLKHDENRYWFSIADSDIALWADAIAGERGLDVRVFEPDASPLAVQGPKAGDVIVSMFGDWVNDLRYFGFRETEIQGIPLILARSGWSKQGGFELYLMDETRGTDLWDLVAEAGAPYDIGPGSPSDKERLESDLVSYGADARLQSSPANPFEMGLGKYVHLDRGGDFIGRDALMKIEAEGIKRRRVGFFVDGARMDGNEQPLPIMKDGQAVGILSDFSHSIRLGRNIGVGLLSNEIADDAEGLTVNFGDDKRAISVAELPFIGR